MKQYIAFYFVLNLNKEYLKEKRLNVVIMQRGNAWLDAGTPDSLMDAGQFVQIIEKRQGLKIACIEEIAYRNGWISKEKLIEIGESMGKNQYGKHLLNVAEGKVI